MIGEAAYTGTGCLQGRVQGTVGEQGEEQVVRKEVGRGEARGRMED